MRSRSDNRKGKELKHPTDGWNYFELEGYVQTVKEYSKAKADYCTFCIYNTYARPEFYQSISIRVPHDLDVLLAPGDFVHILGEITTLWDDKAGRTIIELVATKIEESDGIQRSEPSDEEPF